MAGHSKWSNTKHRKNAQDVKRSKIFTKIIREITIASAKKGQDPKKNFYLRTILHKAYMHNMTKDVINRAIQRGISSCYTDKYILKKKKYSGYGPGGVAIVIECFSDNENRTVSDLRAIFSKFGGKLVNNKSIKYIFQKIILLYFKNIANENKIFDIALKNDIHDIIIKKNKDIEITVSTENFKKVKNELLKFKIIANYTKVFHKPRIMQKINHIDKEQLLKLLEKFKKISEIKNIYHNVTI